MKTKNQIRVALLALMVAGLGACSEQSAPSTNTTSVAATARPEPVPTIGGAPEKPSASEKATTNAPGQVSIPLALRFKNIATVRRAANWSDLVSQFSPDEQAFLESINDRYYGSIRFDSPLEQAQLIKDGFPMPEEWLVARDMGDAELEELATSGNTKAQMFQVDRVSQRLGPIQANRKIDQEPPMSDSEILRQFTGASTMADRLLGTTDSPFAAYLWGQIMSAGAWGNPPEPIAGSFQSAKERGDARASHYMSQFSRQHPNMDAEAVMASYSSLKSAENANRRR